MPNQNELIERYQRKARQAWEMAGCARADGDTADEARHTQDALEYQRLLQEALASEG